VLGAVDVPAEQSACGVPVSLQVERLTRGLATHIGSGFSVLEVDLYSLEGVDRDAALDAVVAGTPSPLVLIDGRLVCSGAVELSAVLDALALLPEEVRASTTD